MRIGKTDFPAGRTHVCGILNVTPDSFSDGGKYCAVDAALARAERMVLEGAQLIDVGGESTRPGFTPVNAEEEAGRVVPVIEAIKGHFDVPVSVDTRKAVVAKEALLAGADMVNDVDGLKGDPAMAGIIAGSGAACCLMHSCTKAGCRDLVGKVAEELLESVRIAEKSGIDRNKILLDPGIGFGKDTEGNLLLIRELGKLRRQLEFPLLLGASRKSVIGNTLQLPVQERLEGTLVTTVFAVLGGCLFVRVHDVAANARAVRMAEAILAAGSLTTISE